jgi:hypothetical protein
MWVVYHKATKKVVGLTANTAIDADKSTALKDIVQGLVDKKPVKEYDAIQVTDPEKCTDYMSVFPDKLAVAEGKTGVRLVIREPEVFSLHVTSDSPNKHPVDGIPTIAGDGKAFTTITIQKIDERNLAQNAERHKEVIYLRTDHGTLQDSQGKNEIRSVQLEKGRASFRLVSSQIKRVATVQVLCAEPPMSTDFRVEFT